MCMHMCTRMRMGMHMCMCRLACTVRATLELRKARYICSCSALSEQHTTQTSLGGRCFESRLFVRRRMNWFTIMPSSPGVLRVAAWSA